MGAGLQPRSPRTGHPAGEREAAPPPPQLGPGTGTRDIPAARGPGTDQDACARCAPGRRRVTRASPASVSPESEQRGHLRSGQQEASHLLVPGTCRWLSGRREEAPGLRLLCEPGTFSPRRGPSQSSALWPRAPGPQEPDPRNGGKGTSWTCFLPCTPHACTRTCLCMHTGIQIHACMQGTCTHTNTCTYIFSCMHTYTLILSHMHTDTQAHAHMHTHLLRMHLLTHMHKYMSTHTCTPTHTHAHTSTWAQTHLHTPIHIHAHTHKYTHTLVSNMHDGHTHMHTHMYMGAHTHTQQ